MPLDQATQTAACRALAPGTLPHLSDEAFAAITELIHRRTGIHLNQGKRNLLISRLSRRLRALGMHDFSQYVELLSSGTTPDELVEMINQITTNKTSFFREPHHFDFLRAQALPALESRAGMRGPKLLRAWSAGCSSGQEAYSLAMTLADYFWQRPGWDWKLLATDLNTAMLRSASQGVYQHRHMAEVAPSLLQKHFRVKVHAGDRTYQVKPLLRSRITFGKFNLITSVYPCRAPLDFIFCRNVLIYFDSPQKRCIVDKLISALRPGGWLFLGHSESLLPLDQRLVCVGPTIYRKP